MLCFNFGRIPGDKLHYMVKDLKKRTKVFISYSHRDQEWLERLRIHLRPLERRYGVEVWSDTDIRPGSKWREEIEGALTSTKVALLLVSADFIASDFIERHELPPLLQAAETDGAVILPLILSPSMFSGIDELAQFQAVNEVSKPLVNATRGEQEAVLVKLTEQIGKILGYLPDDKSGEKKLHGLASERQRTATEVATDEDPSTTEDVLRTNHKIAPAIWVAIITGVAAVITAYWQFIYKPSQLSSLQEMTYTGRVTDAHTKKPIHNAKVSIEEGQKIPQIQRTDSEGIFHVVSHAAASPVRIWVEADGYGSVDRNVSFSRTGIEPVSLIPLPTPVPTQTPSPSPSATQPPSITTKTKTSPPPIKNKVVSQTSSQVQAHIDDCEAKFKSLQYDQAIAACNAALRLDAGNRRARSLKSNILKTKEILNSNN